MNSRERIFTALKCEIPDRVPIDYLIENTGMSHMSLTYTGD